MALLLQYVFSGITFGKVLMMGGYRLGFQVMAVLTLVAAASCLLLYTKNRPREPLAPGLADASPTPTPGA